MRVSNSTEPQYIGPMTLTKLLFVTAALTASFLLPVQASAQTAPAAAKDAKKTPAAKAAPAGAPTAAEIADAKAKGLVWVNLESKVYHKEGKYYGATKKGKFMTEADAQKAGFRAAQEGGAKKTTAATKPTTAPPAKK